MEEIVKFELPQVQLNGKYKIQLFDKDTNELVKEVEKHNVISKIPFSTAFYNHIYRGFAYNDNKYGCDFSNTNNGYINFLMLTNDPEAPENDDKNPVVLGETIGYAQYDDSNSIEDTKKGIFNKNETRILYGFYPNGAKVKNATKHIVWDFPTDKGNGTFDNIYLLPTQNCSNPDSYRGKMTLFDSIVISNNEDYSIESNKYRQGDRGPISHSEKYLYMQCLYYKNETKQHWDKIAQIDLETWERKYITLNVPSTEASKPAYIIYACGMFWRIDREWKTTRYNLSGEYKDTLEIGSNFIMTYYYLRLDGNFIGSSSSTLDFTYFDYFTGDDEYLYISYQREDTDKNSKKYYENHIVVIDKNGKKVSEVLFGKYDSLPVTCVKLNLAYINNEKFLIANTYDSNENPQVFKVMNGTLVRQSNNILKAVSDLKRPFFYSKDGFLFVLGFGINGWEYSLYTYTLVPWGSHCKLDSPVTKTSANTMKIQYDITVDYIIPGMISNLK